MAWRMRAFPSVSPVISCFLALAWLFGAPSPGPAAQSDPALSTCLRPDPDDGSYAGELWRNARIALDAVAEGESGERYGLDIARWMRSLDLTSDWVVDERHADPVREFRTLETPPAEDLVRDGWIQGSDAGESWDYHGLDASTLVSPAFIDAHCFEVREDPADPSRVGLAFEPESAGPVPGVRGVVWLGQGGSTLEGVDFEYTTHPGALGIPPEGRPFLNGSVRFQPLPDGGWITSRWAVTMPRWWPDVDGEEVLGRMELGGEVLRVEGDDLTYFPMRSRAVLEGVVVDSTTSAGLADAVVYLAGTPHAAGTDESGRFRIDVPAGGTYLLGFDHPRLEALGIESVDESEATLVLGSTVRRELAVPSLRTIAAVECGRDPDRVSGAMLLGRVSEVGVDRPLSGVTVRLVPVEDGVADGALETVSGEDGSFRFCAVPAGIAYRAESDFLGIPGESRRIRLAEGVAESMDLVIDLRSEGAIRGMVRQGETGPPIANAGIVLAGSGEVREATSDSQGRFAIDEIPSGTYDLTVSHLGYQEMTTAVRVAGGEQTTSVTVRLLRDAIALDPVTVEVLARPSWGPLGAAYDRRDYMEGLGLGTFFDREALERAGTNQVTRLVSRMPGARLRPGGREGSTASALQIHRTNRCEPALFVDGMRYRLDDGESIDDVVSIGILELVEVYRGPSQLPMEYFDDHSSHCGAIAVWTRRGH